jgi:hypothetical protein
LCSEGKKCSAPTENGSIKSFYFSKNVQILNQQTFMSPYSPGAEPQLAGLEPSILLSGIKYPHLCYRCYLLINGIRYFGKPNTSKYCN